VERAQFFYRHRLAGESDALGNVGRDRLPANTQFGFLRQTPPALNDFEAGHVFGSVFEIPEQGAFENERNGSGGP
jgi:hypothetical protein